MFKNLFRSKATPVWSIIVGGKEGNAVWSKLNQKEAAKTYANIDTVFSCIDILASGFSQIYFAVKRQAAGGALEEVATHPALALLANPAPQDSQSSMLYAYAAWKLITGNSYLVLNNGDDANFNKAPSEINNLRSDRMKIVPGGTGIEKYIYSAGGEGKSFPVDQVNGESNIIHSKTFNPLDDFYGLSPMQAAAKNIDIYASSLQWNKKLLDNSARPSGMFTWDGEGNPSVEQIADIRKNINEATGPENAGKPLFGGKLDFKQMSMSPKDIEFLAGKETTMKDIARVYKVPPILLNIGSDATFSNMAEARLALWDEAIIPMAKCFVGEMNMNLMPRYSDNEILQLNLDAVTSLEPRREKQWERARTADFLTTNEKREIVGFEAIDDGDDILVPASSVPLSFATGDLTDPVTTDPKKKV